MMGSQSRSDSAIMGKPMEAYCAPEPTFSHTNTKCCAAHSTCDHTTPYKPVSIPRAVQDVTSTVVGGQASPQRRRGFSNSKHQPLLHMVGSGCDAQAGRSPCSILCSHPALSVIEVLLGKWLLSFGFRSRSLQTMCSQTWRG